MTRLVPVGVAAALAIGVSGCSAVQSGTNLANGKEQFVQKCGACHVLQRAGTTGVTGPNLDESFTAARSVGMKESTFEGVVYDQILYPSPDQQVDPKTGKQLPAMPAKLVEGDDARDVSAYVATAVAKGGEDTGRLASIGAQKAEGVAKAENGTLEIPADPGGGLAYAFAAAEAPAGPLTVRSPNESSVPHDIALEGNGVNEKGPVVQNGGVSEFEVELQPGEYTFFCSVPGHRQGGMEGKLTVG